MAAELDFFFDPVCPWAWVTSRWVTNVSEQRSYEIDWRFISLWILNEDNHREWYTPQYRAGHYLGQQGLRIADAIRLGEDDSTAVGRWYTAMGTALHVGRQRDVARDDSIAWYAGLLADAGFDAGYIEAADDDAHDAHIRAETELALSRTGKDVGTPILTFHPGLETEASFFGPVISKAPTGEEATELWDAVEKLATMSGMAELKRSNRLALDFT
jgi:Mycothiol-dependent nitroreductase Rv2466c